MTALCGAGGVSAPIYQDGVAEEIAYVLDNYSAKSAIGEGQEQVDKVLEVRDQRPICVKISALAMRAARAFAMCVRTGVANGG